MAQAKVDLSWNELRPRRNIPDCLVRAIPPEDLTAFVRNLAKHPLDDISNATALRSIILSIRQHRCDYNDPTQVTKPFAVAPLAQKRRRDTSPPRANGVKPPRAVLVATPPRRKQRRGLTSPTYAETDEEDTEAAPRPKPKPRGRAAADRGDDAERSRSTAVPISPEYQATIPPLPASDTPRPTVFDPPIPAPYHSPDRLCDDDHALLLDRLRAAFRARDGVPPGPFVVDLALREFGSGPARRPDGARAPRMETDRAARAAVARVLPRVPRGPYLPGLRGALTYDEHSLLARSLMEGSKDFEYMSRCVLPRRTTHELVWAYYALYKQSGPTQTAFSLRLGRAPVSDTGADQFKKLDVSAEVVVHSLASLARTAGDGFPVDSRVNKIVTQYRNRAVQQGRRRREAEVASKGGRLR